MSRRQGKEVALRDYIAKRIGNLPELIDNLSSYESRLESHIERFLTDDYEGFGPLPHHLIHRIFQKRAQVAIRSLCCLKLVEVEAPLLSTHKAGFQPSADILALNFEDGTLFLLEVKQAVGTEREIATELAAYSHGLQQKFWGLAPSDHVWIPVSTVWHTMPRAAIANETIFSHRVILPLKCKPVWSGPALRSVRFEVLNLLPLLDEPLCISLFAWDCFDCYYIAIKKAPTEPEHFLHYIASTGNKLGLSGFTLLCIANIPGALQYDYGIIICVFNPIRGALKRKQLDLVRKASGKRRMRMETKKPLWYGFDFDLRTGKIREYANQKDNDKRSEDFKSTAELASSGRSGLSILWSEVKDRLEYFVGDYELSAPWFHGLLESKDFLLNDYMERFEAFGLIEEALNERLLYEFHHKSPIGNGPVMGDLGADPVQRAARIDTFWQFMELMNFQHESQVDYEDGEDK